MSSTLQIESPCAAGLAGSADGTAPALPIPKLQPHFMLVPSLACPAECSYCFGPHHGPIMSAETMEATLDFMARIVDETGQRKVKVTFHGGEPLLAGHAIWRQALEGLAARFGPQHCDLALQSNLWQLDDEFCRLFRQHQVDVGTSLDGPEAITDAQRGRGYFARTMQAVRLAQSHGLKVGCIATFTPASLPRWREVFDFFLNERLGFSIHAAVPRLQQPSAGGASVLASLGQETSGGSRVRSPHPLESASPNGPFLTPAQYATLLRQMLDYYIEHRRELAVSSLDQMCQGFGCGEGKVCTFRDCLGMFLAIDPNGGIYPCQRFCGQPQHRLGALHDQPTLAELFSSPTAQRMAARQKEVRQACDGCAHLEYCRGGCPYNAWANDPVGTDSTRSPSRPREEWDGVESVPTKPIPPSCRSRGDETQFLRKSQTIQQPRSAAVPAAGSGGVSPREPVWGETPPKPAGEDARATISGQSQPPPSAPHPPEPPHVVSYTAVDPYCEAYRVTFDYIQRRVAEEMAREENINAIADRPWDGRGHPLLRKGPLIELVREGPHPSQVARTAKRIIAAVELAKGPDIPTVGTRLVQMGLCRTQQSAEASLHHLWQQLHPDKVRLNNLYLHVTFDCQLRCTHCYACAGENGRSNGALEHWSDGKQSAADPSLHPSTTPSLHAGEMPIPALEKLLHEAKECGFRQVIITGGEPLIHSQRDAMLDMLAQARAWTAPMNLVLRTNFALPLDEDDLRRIAAAFDQVVASVDGNEPTHDARRGPGTYAATVRNLEAYATLCSNSLSHRMGEGWGEGFPKNSRLAPQQLQGVFSPSPPFRMEERAGERRHPFQPATQPLSPTLSPLVPRGAREKTRDFGQLHAQEIRNRLPPAELSLACVMRAADIQGEARQSVRELAQRLGIRRTRFRPLLPLGRAGDWEEPPTSEALGAHADPMELIESGFQPAASCGLGRNLYVEPSGESFPCYAYHRAHSLLGNVLTHGLSAVLRSEGFRGLSQHTVDANLKYRTCDLRYLCGGVCRAWGGEECQHKLDAPPPECDGLRTRAANLLSAATNYLDTQPLLEDDNTPCSRF